MPKTFKRRLPVNMSALDELSAEIRYGSEHERQWETHGNSFVERHPYLVGYLFMFSLWGLALASHLMMFLMSFLFLYFISDFMTNHVRRYVPFIPRALMFSVLYVVILATIFFLTYKVLPALAKQLPELVNQLQAQLTKELKLVSREYGLTRYVDIDQIRAAVLQASTGFLKFLMDSLTPLYKGVIQFIFALVMNAFLYYDMEKIDDVFGRKPGSMMTFLYNFIGVRLRIFYFYFKRVMGGQVIIAAINTVASAIVILAVGLPHPILMISLVFFCGLFPVVGNLVSNIILCINAFVSIGPWGTGVFFILLVTVHKLEYFLNSKIIGGIVRLPMTITLAALIFCEVLFSIPGLILAIPLALFTRHELEHIPGFPDYAIEEEAVPGEPDVRDLSAEE